MAIKTMDLQCTNPSQGIELTNDILTKIGKSSRIVNAILMPTVQSIRSQAEQYAIKVSYNEQEAQIIDYIKPTVNNRFSVNITEELICKINNEAENIRIIIDSGLAINSTVTLAVEYVSEHLMTDDVASCDVDAHRAGGGKINLATGKLRFNHDLGAGLSLTYNDSQANEISTKIASENNSETTFKHSCGKGWKLNVEQYLVKTVNADNKEIYTYVDAQGNYHEFYEKYYYLDGKQKTYINKEEITTDLNGKLMYSKTTTRKARTGTLETTTITNTYDAFVELKSTSGLTLDIDYSKFKGGKFLELRQNEQIELEESVEAYENQLKQYVVINKDNGDTVCALKKADNTLGDAEVFISDCTDDRLMLTESEAVQYNSLLLQFTSNEKTLSGKTINQSKYNLYEDYSVQLTDNAKSFMISGYDNKLANLRLLVKHLRKDYAKLTKKCNYAPLGSNPIYQYEEYYKFKKNCVDLKKCLLDIIGIGQYKANTSINNLSQNPNGTTSNPKYLHLVDNVCDLEEELQVINDDLEMYYRATEYDSLTNGMTDDEKKNAESWKYKERETLLKEKENKMKISQLIYQFQKNFSGRVDKLQQNISDFETEINDFVEEEQRKLVNRQLAMLIECSAQNVSEIKKYYKQYVNKKHQLNLLYLQLPVSFITSGGNVIGFNKYGQFTAAFDAYENQTAIIYEDNKIVRIQDSDEKSVLFEYDNDLLTKIIFADDTNATLEYANGMLCAIIDCEGTTTFGYDSSSCLISASHSYGRGVKFTRDNYKRIATVNETTNLSSVSDNNPESAKEEISRTLAAIDYHESHLTTTVTDKHDVSKTYVMDIMGKPVTVYEGKFYDPEKTTKSLSLEYVDSKKSFSISEDVALPNLLTEEGLESQNLNGTSDSVRQRIFNVDVSKLDYSNYVFSVWAKADSAYVPNVRNSLYCNHDFEKEFGVNVDTVKQKRKFELRAEYTYSDGTSDSVSAVYDWLNTGWQFVALPIEIKKENGNTLPTEFPFGFDEESKMLVGLQLIVDYSYNTGDFEYDCCSLRKGNWTRTDYYEDGKQKSVQDSRSKSKTEYLYDENDKLVSEELTDYKDRTYTTKYEYNKQGSLVRSTSFDGTVKETVFDEKGRQVKKIVYNLSDPTSKLYTESKRDDKGAIIADVDESGKYDSVKYTYDHNGEDIVHTDGKGNKTAFGYKDGNLVSISGNADGQESTNTMNYTVGLLTKVSCGDTDYNYSYDKWGRTTKVEIAGATYATAETSDNDLINTTVLANGDEFVTETDKYGKTVMQSAKYNNGVQEKVVNEYDPETSRLNKTTIDINGAEAYNVEYEYYEVDGKLLSSVRSGEHALTKQNRYTADGEVESTTYKLAEQELTYTYETDNTPDKRNAKVQLPFNVEQNFAYDGLGRTKEISLTDNLVKDIYYAKYGDHATNRVNSVWHGVNGIRKDNTKYSYDKAGNIATVTENGIETAKYVYDGLNRLVRENNSTFGKITYEYDNAGNILCKAIDGKRYKYTYSQNGWKDQLLERSYKEYDGTTVHEYFKYDVIGNPVIYRNRTLSWQGRRLLRYGNNEYYAEYTYDVNGIRTSKHAVTPAGTVNSKFIYDSNNLVAEQRSGSWIYYLYGVDGVAGFNYKGNTYLYRKNVQGDITHIYKQEKDNSLTQVAHYVYDAWGNKRILQDKDGIATLNPFRYRSYYFDEETGLYYLQSRYYDPELSRFISADSIEYLDPESLGGLNLYAYCGNNPVMNYDPTREFFLTCLLVGLIAGAIIGATIGGVVAYNNAVESGATGWDLVGQTVLGVFAGAVIGGAIGAAIGALVGWAGPAVANFLGSSFKFVLPALKFGGDVLIASTTITLTGAQIAAGVGTIALGSYLFSQNANRYKRKDTRSNTIQNEEFERLADKHNLNYKQRRRLHDRITKKGLTKEEILDLMKKLFPKLFK